MVLKRPAIARYVVISLASVIALGLRPSAAPTGTDPLVLLYRAEVAAAEREVAAAEHEAARLHARIALADQLLAAISAEVDAGRTPRELAAAYRLLGATDALAGSPRRSVRSERTRCRRGIKIAEACKHNALAKGCM